MASCASCAQFISPVEAHLPYPRCGSADRTVTMADQAAATEGAPGLVADFPPASGPWQQMWAETGHRLGVLRNWYSSGQGANVTDLTADSTSFFVSCYHFAEHIKEDPAAPQRARAQARGYANADPAIKLAADIANTIKHGKRRPSERTCKVTQANIGSAGAAVTFTWTDAQGTSGTEDCLDLAERAAKAWSTFLHTHHML